MNQMNRTIDEIFCVFSDCTTGNEKAERSAVGQQCSKNVTNVFAVAGTR
ncbi:hypothetical protein [Methanosarcina sp.]|nr:hypothetical protein [Methanosarcina sp.]MDY9927559.1 hypothetical protein [Methanosarcina sp.]